ncbi:hypothetical protein GF352_04385 [archaeon]|nr:hypothetical protein [archaeon]
MAIYQVIINSHGTDFYFWERESPSRTSKGVIYSEKPRELESREQDQSLVGCLFMALSDFANSLGLKLLSIDYEVGGGETVTGRDINFIMTVDSYMNTSNLRERMKRATNQIIFNNREELSGQLSVDEEERLKRVFNDQPFKLLIGRNSHELESIIKKELSAYRYVERVSLADKSLDDVLSEFKSEGKKVFNYEQEGAEVVVEYDFFKRVNKAGGGIVEEEVNVYKYGVLGVGLLSSSYNILFFKGVKSLLGLDSFDYQGYCPDSEGDLDEILTHIKNISGISSGESKFAYCHELNVNLLIYNLGVGPEVLGVNEPFYLVMAVDPLFASKKVTEKLASQVSKLL